MVNRSISIRKGIENGVLAILAIIVVNLIVLSFLGFPEMAVLQIKKYWFLLLILIGGFGYLVGLHTYLRTHNIVCSATTKTSGGVSSVSMILCCSHYLALILPFFSSIFLFLTKYTPYILLFGIFSNVLGTLFLLKKAEITVKDKARWWTNIIVVLLIIVVASSAFAQYTFHNDEQTKQEGSQPDKCKAPEGYTQEKWIEHMGHHPEQYAECLEQLR
ncbi:MAG: hypothetical protein AABW88_00745 [Nanoarchaeota archaeon]